MFASRRGIMKKYLFIVLVLLLGFMGLAEGANRECFGLAKDAAIHEKPAKKLVIAKLGFSMKLPAGWKAESKEKSFFYDTAKRAESDGWVAEYQLGGKSLSEFVEASLKDVNRARSLQKQIEKLLGEWNLGEEGSKEELPRIRSQTAEKISGLEAIEVVCEGECSVMETFIRKGNEVVGVTFRTLKGNFPRYEDSFRHAIKSIVIREAGLG